MQTGHSALLLHRREARAPFFSWKGRRAYHLRFSAGTPSLRSGPELPWTSQAHQSKSKPEFWEQDSDGDSELSPGSRVGHGHP